KNVLERYKRALHPKEIVLQIGFQAYPTEFADSGIAKIKELNKSFDNRIAFTEHLDGTTEDALYLPTFAAVLGAEIIEKHVMHSSRETKYDYHSSVKVDRFKKYLKIQEQYLTAMEQPFINEREQDYLDRSNQIPILANGKKANSILGYPDLEFRRSSQEGLNLFEVGELLENRYLLNKNKKKHETLKKEDFRPARIAACIACRRHSTRLPDKALVEVGDLPSVQLCIKNVLKFDNVDEFILATSTEEEDAVLENHIYDEEKVRFSKGDPLDVIQRYLDSIEGLGIDVIIRLTADNLYVSNDILQVLLKSHFEQGADYTAPIAKGAVSNMQIVNVSALKKIKEYFPKADYSEYLTYYFQNNPDYFRLNYPKIPKELDRNYRLTLDYPEDLEVFQKIEEHLKEKNKEFSIQEVFRFLDNNPEIANINKNLAMKFKADPELIAKLNEVTKIRE
ncbi:MAG: N-acetylneuraminate synthase family protein, partial [Balneolaceae bacterium]|nr:N-acetylneuraminate synthase family protein [Balneolaceae bacterium]